MGALIRFFKRFAVLIPGILVAYFSARVIFPTIDRRLNLVLAVFITYLIVAYLLIPAAFRIIRIIIKPEHIPLYCTTPDGFANDPVNIGVVGSKSDLIRVMTRAGWHQAEAHTLRNIIKQVLSILRNTPYPNAPFSSLYLFGRSQDMGFQLPVKNKSYRRHHVRFWASTYTNNPRYRDHVHFWQKHQKTDNSSRLLWVGAVSLDTGFAPIRHNAQITHMIHPDTNAERNFLAKELESTGLVSRTRSIKIGDPYKLRNRAFRGYMNADGKMTICELKKPPRSKG